MNREMRRHPKHPALPFVEQCGTVEAPNDRKRPNSVSKRALNEKKRNREPKQLQKSE